MDTGLMVTTPMGRTIMVMVMMLHIMLIHRTVVPTPDITTRAAASEVAITMEVASGEAMLAVTVDIIEWTSMLSARVGSGRPRRTRSGNETVSAAWAAGTRHAKV